MPVSGMTGCQCPVNFPYRDTILYMTVFRYIFIVIVISEIAMIDLPVNGNGSNRQKEAY
jgi:hypothetical protein